QYRGFAHRLAGRAQAFCKLCGHVIQWPTAAQRRIRFWVEEPVCDVLHVSCSFLLQFVDAALTVDMAWVVVHRKIRQSFINSASAIEVKSIFIWQADFFNKLLS